MARGSRRGIARIYDKQIKSKSTCVPLFRDNITILCSYWRNGCTMVESIGLRKPYHSANPSDVKRVQTYLNMFSGECFVAGF